MVETRWNNNPVVFSPEEPSSSIAGLSLWPSTTWKWFNTTNGKWYDYDGGWVMQGDEPIVGVDLAHDGEKMEISKLTIVDGIITELEYTV